MLEGVYIDTPSFKAAWEKFAHEKELLNKARLVEVLLKGGYGVKITPTTHSNKIDVFTPN